mgnify:CR=1 FL=1
MKCKVAAGRKASYTVVFEKKEGGYTVLVPALPGVVTCGRTLKEARAMAEDAILCHIEGLLKDGKPVPQETEMDEDAGLAALVAERRLHGGKSVPNDAFWKMARGR